MSLPKSTDFEKRSLYATYRHREPTKAYQKRQQERRERVGGLGLHLGYSDDQKGQEQDR